MSTATLSSENDSRSTRESIIGQWKLFWLMLLAAVAPMMLPYFTNLWSREPYRYFPLCLLALAWLTRARWDRQFRPPVGALSWSLIALGIALSAFGILIASPWLSAIAMVLFAGTFFKSSLDAEGRSLVSLSATLLMLINLPLGYDQLLTIRLQQITTGLSSVFLDLLTIPHAVSNNVIQLTSRELFVAEACSGIQSVFTLMFLATLLISIYRRPIWLTPIYLVIAALLAVAANVIRVTTVAIGDVWLSVDLAEGWQHELIGYTALLVGVLFLLSFDHLVVTLLHPVDPVVEGENNLLISAWNLIVGDEDRKDLNGYRRQPSARGASRNRGARIWKSLWSRRILVGVLSVIGIAGIAQAINLHQPVPIFVKPTELIYQPNPQIFKQSFASQSLEVGAHEQTRGGSNPRLGENADIWTCQPRQVDAEIQFVLSQPYAGWHELCICYEINAWILLNREIRGTGDVESSQESKRSIPYAFARFKSSDGRFAYLAYSAMDAQGNIVVPPPQPGRLGNRFMEYFEEDNQNPQSNLMMLQMLIVSAERIERERLRELTSDFVAMRSVIRDDIRNGSGPATASAAANANSNSPADED